MSKALAILGLLTIGTLCGFLLLNNQAKRASLSESSIRRELFKQWMIVHDKTYNSASEEEKRFQIWSDNYDFVNSENAKGNTHTLGMNVFADMTGKEWKETFTCNLLKNTQFNYGTIESVEAPPASWNWATQGAVTGVKNQGQCGSCWAFSTTGALEGLNFLDSKSLISFSEQQLVSCSQSYGNQGCNGGLMDYGFQYAAAKGIETEAFYPYTSGSGNTGTCKYNSGNATVVNKAYTDVPSKNNVALLTAVYQQPTSVAVEADQSSWQLYTGGVITKNCGTALDHGVLAVGWGTSGSTPYWIVKNSWGSSWGQSGYVWIGRSNSTSDAGICGIALQASYPTD